MKVLTFYQPGAFTFPMSVCLFVCASALITSLHYYAMPIAQWKFAGPIGPRYVREASLILFCLDGENVVGSDDTTVLASPGR